MKPIANSRLILGPPGCGKTHTLIGLVREALARGVHPSRIGFVSFTTKAIREALDRACAEFNLTPKSFPHFRTLHATGYHGLGLQREDVMGSKDYSVVGNMLGLDFKGLDRALPEDGIAVPAIGGSGAKYLQGIMRARYRQVTLATEFNDMADHNLFYVKMRQVDEQLQKYKSAHQKVDFADMIDQYIIRAEPPHLDLLIVDEAQDLTPLQWAMIRRMAEFANEVVIAGDDDQAIHRWTGVDVKLFLNCSQNIEVLRQSYRLPRAVHAVATKISRQIRQRLQKEFLPRDEEGSVQSIMRLEDAPLDRGSWTIMTRVNSYMWDFGDALERMGLYYKIKARASVPEDLVQNIDTWVRLCNGEAVEKALIEDLYKAVPKVGEGAAVVRGASKLLEAAAPDATLRLIDLQLDFGCLASEHTRPRELLRVSDDMWRYIRALERRGEDLSQEPRIKVSTFHAMKGGEDDNCIVYLGSTKACMESKHWDDELRALYVAVTRTKQNLYLLESDKKYRYTI